jgi:hypothetical protein
MAVQIRVGTLLMFNNTMPLLICWILIGAGLMATISRFYRINFYKIATYLFVSQFENDLICRMCERLREL